ncbi:MAG: type II secretion system F family protein [bacterium]|nr:type II secretion system F family protein [bacterium]
MSESLLFILSSLLIGLSTMGLIWALVSTFADSAKTASSIYEKEMLRSLEAMFLFVPARRLVDLGWMSATVVFMICMLPFCSLDPLYLPIIGLVFASLVGFAAFHLPTLAVNILKKRRLERFNLQLLEVLPMMSNALRAGFSIMQAFENVAEGTDGPMRQEVNLFLQQTRVGVSFSDALQEFDHRVGSEDLTLICTSIEIARRAGGNLTEIFDTIAATIRARLRIHRHVKTLTAQGRLQGIVIGTMPFVLGIGLAIFKPDLMIPFACSMIGAILLGVMTLLVICGGLMIRKIVTIDV